MAAGNTLATNVGVLIPEITFEADLIYQDAAIGRNLVRVEDISGRPGHTAEFPVFTEVTGSSAPAETGIPTSHQMALTTPTLTVARRSVYVILSDLASGSTSGNLPQQVGAAMGLAKAKQDDVRIFGVTSGTTNYATSAGATNASLGITHLLDGLNLLEINEVDDPLTGVLHPFQHKTVRSALVPTAAGSGIGVDQASEMVRNGFVSQMFGVSWFVTNRIGSGTVDATANVYMGLLFARKAIGYAVKEVVRGVEPDRSAKEALTGFVDNYFDSAGVLRSEALCRLYSTSV